MFSTAIGKSSRQRHLTRLIMIVVLFMIGLPGITPPVAQAHTGAPSAFFKREGIAADGVALADVKLTQDSANNFLRFDLDWQCTNQSGDPKLRSLSVQARTIDPVTGQGTSNWGEGFSGVSYGNWWCNASNEVEIHDVMAYLHPDSSTFEVRFIDDFSGGVVVARAKTALVGEPSTVPGNLRATNVTSCSVSLAWDDSSFETSYELQRSEDSGLTWSQIATPNQGETTYTDSALTGSTAFQYRIRSINSNGSSAWSNTVSATTSASAPCDTDGDGLDDADERLLGTNPKKIDSDGDGLLDPWESPNEATNPGTGQTETIENAGFTSITVPELGNAVLWRDEIFGPYGTNDCGFPDSNRRPFAAHRACLNRAPNPLHKDVFLELDWQDCEEGNCFPYDPLHHAPDMQGLKMLVGMFADAPVQNPDGIKGVNLRINVDEPIPHDPNCDQNTSAARAQFFGTDNQRLLGQSYVTAKELAVRYVWSGHSSRDDNHGSCPTPSRVAAASTGLGTRDLEDYDWSPYGDANVRGKDILVTLGILWSCHSDLENFFEPVGDCDRESSAFTPAGFGIFPATVRDDQGNVKNIRYPVARLLGVAEDTGTSQLWPRTLAHLLGHSLGISSDAEVGNDPDLPAVDVDGDGRTDMRPPDKYENATWSALSFAPPSDDGIPTSEQVPNFDFLLSVDSDLDGVPEGQDNCPGVYNPEVLDFPFAGDRSQRDSDFDGRGDECDDDADGDGLAESPSTAGIGVGGSGPIGAMADAFPLDSDNDGLRNVIDGDDDNDLIPDQLDNCVVTSNRAQVDNDRDRIGDACDGDDDNDGFTDLAEEVLGSDSLASDSVPESLGVLESCSDRIDNNGDGLVDLEAPGCGKSSENIVTQRLHANVR